VYLSSVSGSYPYGIPRSIAPQPSSEKLLHFIGAMNAAERSILDAAITQGLKISLTDVAVSVLPETLSSDAERSDWLENELGKHGARIHVLLGADLAASFDGAVQGKAQAIDGRQVLATENLSDVSGDGAAKRRFWSALKSIRPLLTATARE
jgi:hypothetical protein